MNEIRGRQAHILKPARLERENIDGALGAAKRILQTYCPDDVPRERRPDLWKTYRKALRRNAGVIAELGRSSGRRAPR